MRFTFKDPLPSLCSSCEFVTVVKMTQGRSIVRCGWLEKMIHGDVADCSQYSRKGGMTKHDMERAAWTIKTGKSGEVIGFRPPVKREDDCL